MQTNAKTLSMEHTARIISVIVAVLILAGSLINLIRPVYFEAAISLVSLVIFIRVQFFMSGRSRLQNPPVMQICLSVLVFLSLFVGRFFSLYKTVPGFDKSQHFLYGMVFCVMGYVLFYHLNPAQRTNLSVSVGTVAIFATCFALSCGFGWEVFEFTCDRLFNTNMQAWKQGLAHGLIDTMFDLMIDLSGSILVTIVSIKLMRRDPAAFYNRRIAGFLRDQPLENTDDLELTSEPETGRES